MVSTNTASQTGPSPEQTSSGPECSVPASQPKPPETPALLTSDVWTAPCTTDVSTRDPSSDEADDEDSPSEDESALEPERLVVAPAEETRRSTTCAKVQAHCWFLNVPFGKSTVRFLVDSGSEVTIIRSDVFKKESTLRGLPLKHAQWKLSGIGGENVPVRGVTNIPITLGNKAYWIEALVADITTPGVLGMNFLEQHNVTSNFHKGELTMDGEVHFLQRKDPIRSFQVKVARATVVPAFSEQVIRTQPIRPRNVTTGRSCCLQPASTFASKTGLALGGTLVTSHARRMPVLVVNPTSSPVLLHKGLVAATCVPAVSMKAVPTTAGPASSGGPAPLKLPDHLERMVPKLRLNESQCTAVRGVLAQYADVFMSPDGTLGKTSVAEHRIDLTDNRPFRQRLRRAAQAHQEVIDQEVQKMLDLDIIEPCDSPWASPVVMVKKKDGTWRFCVDYRKLNDTTRKDSYPLPHIEDTFDALAGSHYFCALDLASGYWQVEMAEEDKPKTAFVTKQGLYQFKVMPFGLCNAPATFERLMEMVLKGYLWKRCMVYIDDVVVYGRSFEETLTNFQLVLERIRQAGLKLKPTKCELFATEILYLGFMVTGKGVRPDPAKVDSVRKWPRPCNVADVRSFLGFASYHRRFIKGFSDIARPLTELTQKGIDFVWEDRQEKAFLDLRVSLCTAPVLSHPRPNCDFILDTDASNFAVGGVLSQVVDGKEQVIAFASSALSHSQMNYCTTHRELLAVVSMTKRFRHYLLGRRFLLRTDHSSLRWLLNYRDVDGMLARWLVKLQEYDMLIEHRPGRLHGNADGLSRCHKCKNAECPGAYNPADPADSASDSRFDVGSVTCVGVQSAAIRVSSNAGGASPSEVDAPLPKATHASCGFSSYVPGTNMEPYESVQTQGPHGHYNPCADYGGLDPGAEFTLHNAPPWPAQGSFHRARARASELESGLNSLTWLEQFSKTELAEKQRADPALLPIILAMENKVKPANPRRFTFNAETQALASRWEQLRLRDGLLYRRVQRPWTQAVVMQLVLPAVLRVQVLHELHDLRVTGHLGIQRTVARVQQRFYWPGCSLDVARWCAACPQCASRKGKPAPGRHPLTTVQAGAPFDRIALDVLDTHNTTPGGFRYILVISDYFTKWTDAFPMRRHTAQTVAGLLMKRFVVYHGVPKQIHSDQGAEFESHLFRHLAHMLGSKKVRTTPYRPQSDGQVERFNRSVLNMLSAFVCDRANDWDDHLPYVLMAYRSSVHSSTGCTPFVMVHGREQNLPVDLMFPTAAETGPPPQCAPEYVEWVRRAIATAHNFARAHLDKSAVRQKRGYDAHAKERPGFAVGDKVRYYYPPVKQGNKFARPWIGPFTVVKKTTDVDYRIRRDSDPNRTLVTHVDSLKPYEGPISLDIKIQAPVQDDTPLRDASGQHALDVNKQLLHTIGVPVDEPPVVQYDDSVDEDPVVARPRRHGAGVPPKRLGWD